MMVAVIPAWNEEQTIGGVVQALKQVVDRVVVVDDGSTDQTGALARQEGAVVLTHRLNRGQGAALQTGQEWALLEGADFVVHFDADGQFDPTEILPALDALKKSGKDVLFGSRFLRPGTNMPFTKKYILSPLSKLVNRFFGSPYMSDVHNGFRILNRKALQKIRIEQDKMAHATEIPVQVKKHGLTYMEFPVTVRYFEYGQNVHGGLKILKDLVMGQFLR